MRVPASTTRRSPFRRAADRRRGFTLVEVLVVIAIVAILASLLLVAVTKARNTAARSRTSSLLNGLKMATVQFKTDHGYYPPVLRPEIDANAGSCYPEAVPNLDEHRLMIDPISGDFDPVQNIAAYRNQINCWFSLTSPAEYLLGWGSEAEDGRDGLGLRSPGTDGVWGAAALTGDFTNYGELTARMPSDEGKVFDPYIDISDDRLIGSLTNAGVFFPGDANYDATAPKVICDAWGTPVRYYRRVYRPGDLETPFLQSDLSGDGHTPSLADVIALRPYSIRSGEEQDVLAQFADGSGDPTASRGLFAAEFAYLSAGPDGRINESYRVGDPSAEPPYANEDNLVEVGP